MPLLTSSNATSSFARTSTISTRCSKAGIASRRWCEIFGERRGVSPTWKRPKQLILTRRAYAPTLAMNQVGAYMPVKVQIPQAMRQHADGQATVDLAGANIKEVLDALGTKFPNITGRIFENGQVRRFVNI